MTDELLKENETTHQLMQIDQKGCKQGSMGCIDNLQMDKAILEDAQFNRKNIHCVWVDVKKAFDSRYHTNGLNCAKNMMDYQQS